MKKTAIITLSITFVLLLILIYLFNNITTYLFSLNISHSFPRFELLKLTLQAGGGIAILFGVYISVRTLYLSEKNIEFNSETLRISQSAHRIEKLSKAIEFLSNQSSEIRIAGFYSLINISKTDISERENIHTILTSYLRNRTKLDSIDSDEVQVLINLMFRNDNRDLFSKYKTNLEGAHLSKLIVSNSKFLSVSFHECILSSIYFQNSNLSSSFITSAKLYKVNFDGSDLSYTLIDDSQFIYCSFVESDLTGIRFSGSTLQHCNFNFAKNVDVNCFIGVKLMDNCHGISNELIELLKKASPETIIT